MKTPITRRKLLQAGTVASASLLVGPASMARTYAANEKIRFALVGIGGMGGKGVDRASGEQIVAAADVDVHHAGGSIKKIKSRFPEAKIYSDYRKLFDEQKHLDAAWVATPDHSHFPPASRPRRRAGRLLREAAVPRYLRGPQAAQTRQGKEGRHADGKPGPFRRERALLCEWIWQGSLGDVTEAHVRPPFNQWTSAARPGEPISVPAGFDWGLWQGPVKTREFRSGIHPAEWRGWIDYGTGLLGDWFCHNADGAVWALKLYEADTCEVECEGDEPSATNWPHGVRISWTFPKRGDMVPASCDGVPARTTTSRCPRRSTPSAWPPLPVIPAPTLARRAQPSRAGG